MMKGWLLTGACAGLVALTGCGNMDREAPPEIINDNGGHGTTPGTNPGTSPESQTGFAGVWKGQLTCDLREEDRNGVRTDQATSPGESHFDANGDMLMVGSNNQSQAQDREGLIFEYILDGGGTGSRELVLLQKGANTRRYEYRYRENRTTTDSGGSSTDSRQAQELYDFTLNGDQLSVRYEIAAQSTSFISTEAGSVSSSSSGSALCAGTFTR